MNDSIRQYFCKSLRRQMERNDRIWLLTGDLGNGALDEIATRFPARFLNPGAAEQLLIGVAVGLALEGYIPFCYSTTPFLLYRPFEWIRNYVSHESIPVKLIGIGLDDDFKELGFSHHCFELNQVLKCLPNIETFFPKTISEIDENLTAMIYNRKPSFICLRR